MLNVQLNDKEIDLLIELLDGHIEFLATEDESEGVDIEFARNLRSKLDS